MESKRVRRSQLYAHHRTLWKPYFENLLVKGTVSQKFNKKYPGSHFLSVLLLILIWEFSGTRIQKRSRVIWFDLICFFLNSQIECWHFARHLICTANWVSKVAVSFINCVTSAALGRLFCERWTFLDPTFTSRSSVASRTHQGWIEAWESTV